MQVFDQARLDAPALALIMQSAPARRARARLSRSVEAAGSSGSCSTSATCRPSLRLTSPSSRSSRPAITFSSELLPVPLRPISPMRSPSSTVRDARSSRGAGRRRVRRRARSAGSWPAFSQVPAGRRRDSAHSPRRWQSHCTAASFSGAIGTSRSCPAATCAACRSITSICGRTGPKNTRPPAVQHQQCRKGFDVEVAELRRRRPRCRPTGAVRRIALAARARQQRPVVATGAAPLGAQADDRPLVRSRSAADNTIGIRRLCLRSGWPRRLHGRMEIAEPLWRPSSGRIERAHITAFLRWLERERGLTFADYEALWQWSVNDLEGFWGALWHFLDIRVSRPYERVLGVARDARRRVVRRRATEYRRPGVPPCDRCATGDHRRRRARRSCVKVSWTDLRRQVASLAATLRELGVVSGRPRRRHPAQRAADHRRVPRLCQRRCDLVGVLAGHGPARRARPLSPDCTRVLIAVRRLSLRWQGVTTASQVLAEIRAALPSGRSTRSLCRLLRDDVDDRAFSRHAVVARADGRTRLASYRAGGVGPSALGRVFVGHDRPAEGDRARPRRRAARDAQGCPSAS